MTQKLTVAGVKRAALKFYKARKLTAQHKDQDERQCVYHDGDYRCAIGAALTADTIKRIDEQRVNSGADVTCLWDSDIVTVAPKENVQQAICAIQKAHDDWANESRQCGASSLRTVRLRKAFLALVAA